VQSMTTHPTGVRRPDMAAELERLYATSNRAAQLLSAMTGVPAEVLPFADAACEALERRKATTHHDVIVEAVAARLGVAIDAATAGGLDQLQLITRLPRRALRTEAGWRRALTDAGIPDDHIDIDALDELPGTELVVTLHRVVGLLRVDRSTLRVELERAYTKAKRRNGFDATVKRLRSKGIDAERCGWAVIVFETHQHVNLIWHQANKLERTFPDRSAADLLAFGWLGLRTALRLYDPDLGYAFSTYACTRITGSIRDGVRSESPIPKRLGTFGRKVQAAEAELTQTLGRAPTLDEVSSFLGTEKVKLALLPRIAPEGSVEEILDATAANGSSPSWIVDHNDPADEVERTLTVEAVSRALQLLPHDEAEAVRLLIMDELHPTKAREMTGATARQMRQRRDRGLETLKEFLADWSPEIIERSGQR
jgi:RNA polymerase sigma factor (sigma-70 family)